MIKIIQSYQVQGSVIAIHSDQDSVFFTNTIGNLFRVDKAKWTLKDYALIPETHPPLHTYQKGASFSQNGQVGYSIKQGKHCALCQNLPEPTDNTEETPAKVPAPETELLSSASLSLRGHDQRAEVMTFCGNKGQYLLTGGTDGKVYMYSTQSGKILMSLKPRPDYISHVSVDAKGVYLVYTAYDKSFTILNLRQQKELLYTYLEDVIEDSFFYNATKSLYAIGREGNSYTYDFKSNEFSKKALFPSWPVCCVSDYSGRFAIVGTRNGTIHIVKLSDNSVFSSFKLDQKGISSLHIEEATLHVGFENGWVYIIDMHAFIDDFSQALSIKNYKTAKRCLDQNLFLAIHPMSELFQEAWEETLKEIITQFSTGHASSALEFAAPFLSDSEHKKEFEFLFQKQKEFEKFALLVQNKEFLEAFGMLERSPYLNKTDSARKLELYFTKSFAEAKKLFAADPLRNGPKAQEILKPFCVVPAKKEMIHSLYNNYDIYLKADGYIKEKKIKEYFTLTGQYPYLTVEEVYAKVCALAESSIQKLKNLIEEGMYDNALQGIKQIAIFLPYRDQLVEMGKEIHLRQRLLAFILNDQIQSAYEIVAAYPILESMKEFAAYDETFDEVLSNAMIAVGKGEIKQVQQILSPYAGIAIFKPKIKECVRQACINKLSHLLSEHSLSAAQTIASYYLREFGKDEEYERLHKQYGLAA